MNGTADAIAYLLMGALPLDACVHKKRLSLFGSIIRMEDSVEYRLASRQLAMKDLNSSSWFQETTSKTSGKYQSPGRTGGKSEDKVPSEA